MSGEPEETVVFNYLVEEFVHETPTSDKQEDSFDENQNAKSNKQGSKRKRSTERTEARVLRKRDSPAGAAKNQSKTCGATVARKGRKLQADSPKTVKVNGTRVNESEGTLKGKKSVCNGPEDSCENITIKIENFEDDSTENSKSTLLYPGKVNGKSETSLIRGDNIGKFCIINNKIIIILYYYVINF